MGDGLEAGLGEVSFVLLDYLVSTICYTRSGPSDRILRDLNFRARLAVAYSRRWGGGQTGMALLLN